MPLQAEPLISILLPAYNAEATLPACLRSVRRQRETRWQCVVVDDGSCDATAAVAQAAAAADPRFSIVALSHGGLVPALNAGLAHCRGRYIARLDADDVMHRDRLAAQLAALEGDRALAAVGTHVRIVPRTGLSEGRRNYERWLNTLDSAAAVRRDAFVECPVAHPTLLIRHELLHRFGYRDCGWAEDYDLLLRLLATGHDIGVVPRRLLLWRDSPARLTRTNPTYGLDRFTACKAAFLAGGYLAAGERYALWGYGATGRALCAALRAHGKRPASIVEVHPGRQGNIIAEAPVVAPDDLATLDRLPLLVSVAGEGPRAAIRRWLIARGWVELRDFVCAA